MTPNDMEKTRLRKNASWITENQEAFENLEDLKSLSQVLIKIVRYMKDNGLTQKELAKRLNVTPQYVNKLLHGADADLRITTALRYGRLLGLDLITVPELDEPDVTVQKTISQFTFEFVQSHERMLEDSTSYVRPWINNQNSLWQKRDFNCLV